MRELRVATMQAFISFVIFIWSIEKLVTHHKMSPLEWTLWSLFMFYSIWFIWIPWYKRNKKEK